MKGKMPAGAAAAQAPAPMTFARQGSGNVAGFSCTRYTGTQNGQTAMELCASTAAALNLGASDYAVFEDLKVKHDLLRRLNEACPPSTLFASNTSTLSITEIAAGSGRDERVVGMHFCLPAQLMKLVEMSPGMRTSEEAFQAAWEFCEAMGQVPVKTKDNPGFILNYFLIPFNNDVIRMVEAGLAEPADIDRAIKTGLGYAMGPLELLDLVGLDTHLLVAEALYAATHEPRAAVPALVKRMIAAGHLGRKTGQGFYRYGGNAMFGA